MPATIAISPLYPLEPDEEARRTGQPVTQETLARFVDTMNHLAVVRGCRRFSHAIDWEPVASFGLTDSNVLYDPPQDVAGEIPLTWVAGPYASRLYLRIAYQGPDEYSAAPLLSATLTTRAGADLDDPGGGAAVTWSVTNGQLPVERRDFVGPFPAGAFSPGVDTPLYEWPLLEVATGTDITDPIRTLDISGGAGLLVELVVAYQSVRPHRIDVIELPVTEVVTP